MWPLLLQTGWDALGLLAGGDSAYTARSYDVLRQIPGGMRTYGPLLGALFLVMVWTFDRYTRGEDGHPLRICLSFLAGWYVLWALGITAAWVVHREILAWPSPARLAVLAALFVIAARAIPAGRRTATGR